MEKGAKTSGITIKAFRSTLAAGEISPKLVHDLHCLTVLASLSSTKVCGLHLLQIDAELVCSNALVLVFLSD